MVWSVKVDQHNYTTGNLPPPGSSQREEPGMHSKIALGLRYGRALDRMGNLGRANGQRVPLEVSCLAVHRLNLFNLLLLSLVGRG